MYGIRVDKVIENSGNDYQESGRDIICVYNKLVRS